MSKQVFRVRVGSDVTFFEKTDQKDAAAYVSLVEPKWQRSDDGSFIEGDPVWHDGRFYGKTAEALNQSFQKGDSLVVMGESKTVTNEVEGKQYTKNELTVKTFGPDLAYETVTVDRSARASRAAAQSVPQEQSQTLASDAEVDQAAAKLREEATKAALFNQVSSIRNEVNHTPVAAPTM